MVFFFLGIFRTMCSQTQPHWRMLLPVASVYLARCWLLPWPRTSFSSTALVSFSMLACSLRSSLCSDLHLLPKNGTSSSVKVSALAGEWVSSSSVVLVSLRSGFTDEEASRRALRPPDPDWED